MSKVKRGGMFAKDLETRVAGWHGCSDPWVAWVEPEHSEGRDSGKNPVLCQRPPMILALVKDYTCEDVYTCDVHTHIRIIYNTYTK